MVKKLDRRLGLGAVIAISIGSMLGSGIFVLPGVAFTITGPHLYLAFLLAALCILPAAVSKSELASAMPTSGGTYVYLERTFGPLAGTVSGLGLYLSMLLKATFALVGFGAYLDTITNIPIQLTALGLLACIIALNIFGVGKVSGFVTLTVIMSILSLIGLSGFTLLEVEHLNNSSPLQNGGLLEATALVFVAYAGVTKVAAIAEEIKNPGKNLPRGILFSLFLVTAIYCLVTYVMALVVPMNELAGDLHPVYSLAVVAGGPGLGLAFAVVAILTMTSMANAGILAASRFPFAMGRDNLLPSIFGRLNQRFLTPVWSILACGVLMATAILTLDVVKIAKLASSFIIIIYMLENIAVIVLRETRVQWYQPMYKSMAYPVLQLFGIASSLALLFAMGAIIPIAITAISVPGLLIYILFSRKQTDRRGVLGIRLPRKDLVDTEDNLQRHIEEMRFTEKANVVVSMFGNERAPEVLTELGLALAGGKKLEVVHLTEVPEQTELDDISGENVQIRAIRRRLQHMSLRQGADVDYEHVVSHDIFKTLSVVSQSLHCQWLVTEWGGKSRGTFTLHNPMGWLSDHLSSNLMTFRDKGVRYFKKILVIVKTDRSNELLLMTAEHLARVNQAEITLCTFVHRDADSEVSDWQNDLLKRMAQHCPHVEATLVVSAKHEWQAYTQATEEFDMVIIESEPTTNSYRRFFGSNYDKLMEHSTCSVVSIRPSRKNINKGIRKKLLASAQAFSGITHHPE